MIWCGDPQNEQKKMFTFGFFLCKIEVKPAFVDGMMNCIPE